MAELKDAADQFAKDLLAQNIAGLMVAFTPNGMMQAMALQSQMPSGAPGGGTPSVAINVTGQEGDDHLVDLVMSADGEARTIATRWKDIAGSWKVDSIALKG